MKQSTIQIAIIALILAGCASVEENTNPIYKGVFTDNIKQAGESQPQEIAHEGPWTLEELAVRAGLRSEDMKEGQLDIMIERLKMEEDLALKNPEFRYSHQWGDDDEYQGNRKVDPDGDWNKWLESSRKNTTSKGRGDNFGLRLYIPNPFLNHYVGRSAQAALQKREARAASDAYGIYTEVKLLGAEYLKARREADLYNERVAVVSRLRDVLQEGRENRVIKSPVDLIRSEAQYRKSLMREAELERDALYLKRTIARLAGVPFEGFEISADPTTLPDPGALSADTLAEIAFARRPDLAEAIAEFEEADARVGATKIANIPWFRYVEAGYKTDKEDTSSRTRATEDYTYTESHSKSKEKSLDISITVPVFNWFGESVNISKQVRRLAKERVDTLYGQIRDEIDSAINNYKLVYARIDQDTYNNFIKTIESDIAQYADNGATVESEIAKSRQELVDYKILQSDLLAEAFEALINLESVIGGPIPQ